MSFGLKNAPATFQRAVEVVLSSAKGLFALVYINDIIMFSRSIEDHFRHLGRILTLISDAGFSLKLKKCIFLRREIDYLGHVVRLHKLRVQPRECDAAKTFESSTLLTGIGICNVYRQFVLDFAKVAAPPNARLKSHLGFSPLSTREISAFDELKRLLSTTPVPPFHVGVSFHTEH